MLLADAPPAATDTCAPAPAVVNGTTVLRSVNVPYTVPLGAAPMPDELMAPVLLGYSVTMPGVDAVATPAAPSAMAGVAMAAAMRRSERGMGDLLCRGGAVRAGVRIP